MKKIKIKLIIVLLILFSFSFSFSYWAEKINFPDIVEKQPSILIGVWLNNTKNYKSGKVYKIGDIVIRNGKMYRVRLVTSSDPLNVANASTLYVPYSENTSDYRKFHLYVKGDFVILDGKVYEYNYFWANHLPNSIRAISPPSARWDRRSDLDNKSDKLWYKHKIYFKGDIVEIGSDKYECIKEGRTDEWPPSNSDTWKKIT